MRQIDILIQNQVRTLLNEGVHQTFKSNQTPGDPWPDNAPGYWKGPELKSQKYLEKIKASKFNLGSVSAGLARNPIYVLNWKTETYWFYHNNEVYSLGGGEYGRDLGYDVKNVDGEERLNLYKLPDDRGENTLLGYYTWDGSQLTWTPKVEKSKSDTEVVDKIHMALDIAGFIPVIGDAVDLVHAVWYFYEGNIFEGILSSLAVIPVVGSFIAASGKAVVRTMKGLNKVDDMGEIALAIVKKMNPTKAEMALINRELAVIYDKVGSSKMLSDLVGTSTIDDILKQLDKARKKLDGLDLDKLQDISKQQANLGKAIDATADASKLTDKATSVSGILGKGKINKELRKISSLTYEASAKETGNLLVKLVQGLPGGRKLTSGLGGLFQLGVKPKQAQALVNTMARGFIKRVKQDPDKLLLIIKTSNKLPVNTYEPILKNMNNLLKKSQKNLDVDSLRKYAKNITVDNAGKIKKFKINDLTDSEITSMLTSGAVKISPKDLAKVDADGLRTLMSNVDEKQFATMADTIAKHAIDNDNPFWNSMLSDPQSKLKAWIWPGDFKGAQELLVANLNDVRKWADIVYNEASAVLGDTVIDEKIPGLVPESPRRESFIYPAVKTGMKKYAPDTYGMVKGTIGKDGVLSAMSPLGLPDESMAAYDPNKSK